MMSSSTNNKFRAVLFDLDGTLLDTIDDLADSMNAVLARHSYPTHSVELYKTFVGDGVEVLALRALPKDECNEQTVREVVMEMRDEYEKRWNSKTKPYPGVSELLDGLERKEIRITILSNKADDYTKKIVEDSFSGRKFNVVRGAKPGTPKKPDPTSALQIAKDIEIDPKDFLYLGDTNTDMTTALRAGMYPVGALWGFRTSEELIISGAKKLIAKPQDLLNLL